MKKPNVVKEIEPKIQHRLDVLERLIDSDYSKSPKVFEDETGIKMSQVNQWFSGYRPLRDKALKRLEEKTKKPEGFFDSTTIAITAPSPYLSASGGPSNPALAHVNTSPVATNSGAEKTLSVFALSIGRLFDKLTEQQQDELFGQITALISDALHPPASEPLKAQERVARRGKQHV